MAGAARPHRRPITVGSRRECRIYRRFEKIKGALKELRETVLVARRANVEQNDRLVKLDLIMDNMINNFCDPELM